MGMEGLGNLNRSLKIAPARRSDERGPSDVAGRLTWPSRVRAALCSAAHPQGSRSFSR